MAQEKTDKEIDGETIKGAGIGAGVGVVVGTLGGVALGAEAGTVGAALAIGGSVISAPVIVPAVIGAGVIASSGALIANAVAKHKAYKVQKKEKTIQKEDQKIKLTQKIKQLDDAEKEKKEQEGNIDKFLRSLQRTKQNMKSQEDAFIKANKEHGFTRDSSQMIIVMIGKTGHGKSTLGNRLCGDTSKKGTEGPFETSAKKHKACTRRPQSSIRSRIKIISNPTDTYNDEGQNYTTSNPTDDVMDNDTEDTKAADVVYVTNTASILVVDTPGWSDVDQKNDDHHKNLVVRYLKGSGGINVFVMVMTDGNRIDGSMQQMLREYEILFGEEFWDHLMIVVTRVDDEDDLEEFEDEESALDIQNVLKEKFEHLKGDIPVIPIGKKVYTQQIELIIDAIPRDRFVCNALKGPYELLSEKYEGMVNRLKEMNEKIERLEKNIVETKEEISSLKTIVELLTADID